MPVCHKRSEGNISTLTTGRRGGSKLQPTIEINVGVVATCPLGHLNGHVKQLLEPIGQLAELRKFETQRFQIALHVRKRQPE